MYQFTQLDVRQNPGGGNSGIGGLSKLQALWDANSVIMPTLLWSNAAMWNECALMECAVVATNKGLTADKADFLRANILVPEKVCCFF